ncbi:probable glycosyltransferase At5g11130 [Daucus carota subsp. sativus]|nr:PREDICTED: probable glycosyltransferase At5g11130 isoform X1 [Daucus carota subsp. sativus]
MSIMARSLLSITSFPSSRRNLSELKGLFWIPTGFLLGIYFFIFFHVSSTMKLVVRDYPHHTHFYITPKLSSSFNNITSLAANSSRKYVVQIDQRDEIEILHFNTSEPLLIPRPEPEIIASTERNESSDDIYTQRFRRVDQEITKGEELKIEEDIFHDRNLFLEDYKEMNSSLKIFVYPHKPNHPFANVLLPYKFEPGGNYASESYFKKALMTSHFITNDPSEADLFFLPFSIASLRHDKRVGVGGIQDFIRDYIYEISHEYPYWNRSGGADHFYVACHSIGKMAMEKAVEVRGNAIQLVCSSNYFLQGYVPHKDASVPQIWPRQGDPPNQPPSKRKTLAFYAGAMNSRVRESLVGLWKNDSEISVHQNRLKTPYHESLLGSKFCIHAKGFEVNTARIGDALYYGCVPVILADHYDLPFADTLNWKSFSVVVSTADIPELKKILKEIEFEEYVKLQKNVMEVRNHFQWHTFAVNYDAFYMVMYELWLRRTTIRVY